MASEDEFLSDEELARKLQEQFDGEADAFAKAEEADRKFAEAVAAGVHELSDSTSEPDVSVVSVTPAKKCQPNRPTELIKQNSSLHTISDSESGDETQEIIPNTEPKKQAFKFSFMKHDSDKESDETLDLSSDNGVDQPKPSTSKEGDKPKSDSLKRASSSIHEISDSGEESDSIISPSPKSGSPVKTTNNMKSSQPDSSGGKRSRKQEESDEEWGSSSQGTLPTTDTGGKPRCKFGKTCFRRNQSHLKQFWHPETDTEETSPVKKRRRLSKSDKSGRELFDQAQPLSFLMTKVEGIDDKYNNNLAINITDILDPSMGKLLQSVQFNYKIDIPWLMEQYPPQFRDKPVLIVHGATREEKTMLSFEASKFDHVKLCQARLDIPYGTHHTKMMFLRYDDGLRIVIHTSNLIHQDWHQKSQGVWISPVFPKLKTASATEGDSPTNFKKDLLQYLAAYKTRPLEEWQTIIKGYDFSSAKVHIIGSVPGRHTGEAKTTYGHLKLKKVLNKHGPVLKSVQSWPVIGQFSSVGAMGKDAANWLTGEWLLSLSGTKTPPGQLGPGPKAKLSLIYPSKENVRMSLEGYPAGGSLPYSISTAKKQPFLHEYFHQWKSDGRGRSQASPHIKTYTRVSPDCDKMAWFLVTSANLSKAAWGVLEKGGSQLMIRSYEIGVFFSPYNFGASETFGVMESLESYDRAVGGEPMVFPAPYDLPLTEYNKGDRPWVWDIPYVDKPDTNGMKWCPK